MCVSERAGVARIFFLLFTAWGSEIESLTSLIKLHQNERRTAPCSTPAHSHNSFPSGIAVEPDEQQALTYLNRERKVF